MSNQRLLTIVVSGQNGQRPDVLVPMPQGFRPTPDWLFPTLVSRGDLAPGKRYLLTGNTTMYLDPDEPLQIFEPDPRVLNTGHASFHRTAPTPRVKTE